MCEATVCVTDKYRFYFKTFYDSVSNEARQYGNENIDIVVNYAVIHCRYCDTYFSNILYI